MASTYSDRLRIELIAAGDQSGTWGDTTNANLGTLIEEAIAGVANISMSDANKTLTSNNGVTDEARQMILKLTGTLTATREVVVPPKEKLYIVHNGATGGKVHVKTASVTGVEVSPGFKAVLYCDGTNVISVLPQALNETTTTNNVLSYDGSNWVATNVDTLVTSFSSGMIMNWAGNLASPPSGWLTCDGSAQLITTYPALHTAIGTTFGGSAGNFNLPDMRDKFVVGAGTTYNQGDTGGSADAIIPSHTHTASFSGGSHYHNVFRGENAGGTSLWQQSTSSFIRTYATANRTQGADGDVVMGGTNSAPNGGRTSSAVQSGTVTVNTTGTSVTNANLPPYIGIGYIIKT